MQDPKELREFSSMDDSPLNTGTFGNDRDWDELFNREKEDDDEEEEDDWEGDFRERFD